MTLVNHAVVTFGLKAMRTARLTGGGWRALRPRQEVGDLGRDDLLRIAGAEARLHHRRRIDIDLHRGLAAAEHIALEIRRDIEHERVLPGVHQRNDVALGDRPRRA